MRDIKLLTKYGEMTFSASWLINHDQREMRTGIFKGSHLIKMFLLYNSSWKSFFSGVQNSHPFRFSGPLFFLCFLVMSRHNNGQHP